MADSKQLSSLIARHPGFQDRVRYYMTKAAIAILNGTPDTGDNLLGQSVLDGNEDVYAWSLAALTNATIAAGAHSDTGDTIIDPDLEFAVNSAWPAFKV